MNKHDLPNQSHPLVLDALCLCKKCGIRFAGPAAFDFRPGALLKRMAAGGGLSFCKVNGPNGPRRKERA